MAAFHRKKISRMIGQISLLWHTGISYPAPRLLGADFNDKCGPASLDAPNKKIRQDGKLNTFPSCPTTVIPFGIQWFTYFALLLPINMVT
jgi:hypothetical protein